MNQLREILRLIGLGRSVRETARSLGISSAVVSKTTNRARTAMLDLAEVESLDDTSLERRLYGEPNAKGRTNRPLPDPVQMHLELKRPGVTLELLHIEYQQRHPEGYRYTAFCEVYRQWKLKQRISMRQSHKAGEKMFVDYSGKKPHVVDRESGECIQAELFVAVLGASNYTYIEASRTQRVEDFVSSQVRALEYFEGAATMIVPDNLKSAVVEAHLYEPTIQRTYSEFGRHYGTAIVPARPYRPRDKAKVEVAVQVAQRWVLARIRNETFFSLADLNERIRELTDELNQRPMKHLGGKSRRDLYLELDKPALRALPTERYEVARWKRASVAPDYHVEVNKHWYSVPYSLVREEVETRATQTTVEIYFKGERVASHSRSREEYRHTTEAGHMPKAHQRYGDGVDWILQWSAKVGPMTAAMVNRIIERQPIRERGWRSAMGLKRLAETYGPERLEKACEQALHLGAHSYKPVERLLRLGREQSVEPRESSARVEHGNVRGPGYFH